MVCTVLMSCLLFVPFKSEGYSEGFVEVYSTEEDEELKVRKTFPQYRMYFDDRKIQEEVYQELLKEQKKEDPEDKQNPSTS